MEKLALKAMKQAREALYPEYRALIQLLNAFALVSDNVHQYATLISTLNGNIDYVRIHAMKDGGETQGGGGSSQSGEGGEQGGGENGGGESGGDNGGSGGFDTGDNGGSGGFDTGD